MPLTHRHEPGRHQTNPNVSDEREGVDSERLTERSLLIPGRTAVKPNGVINRLWTGLVYDRGKQPERGVLFSNPSPSQDNDRDTPDTKRVELLLLNNGSVARDHLASERTFLAYVRTSLGLASAGVALMQFLLLGHWTRKFASLLGAITIFSGLTVLYVGTRRFFLVQKTLVTGHYPATMFEVAAISFLLGMIITITFGIVIADQLRHQ